MEEASTDPVADDTEMALQALTDEERDIVLDSAVSGVRDRPDSFQMYNDRKMPPKHVVRRAQRYDPNVFFRWNRILTRWELWRWRGAPLDVPTRAVRQQDIGIRAVFCYVIRNQDRSFRPVGDYILSWLYAGDPWRKYSHDTETALKMVDAEDEDEDQKDEQDMQTSADDWAHDSYKYAHGKKHFPMSGAAKE